jgi:hypothetical protein
MINIIRISVSVILLIGGLLLVPTTTVMGACHAVPTFADNLKPTNHLPVAVNGSDINGDGSPDSPYATITHAVRQATPGTAIVVHAGVYPGGIYLAGVSGTASAPIWIGGAAGESRPVIEGGGEGIHFSRGRYVVLHDLEVRNATQNGINFDDGGDYSNPLAAHHIIFERLYIHDNPSSSTPGLPAPESDGIYGHDPLLNDPTTGDYRIGPESPAVGTGLSPASLEGDIAGSCYRQPPGIGAYEYIDPCEGDSEPDSDVDGLDLWKFLPVAGQTDIGVAEFAADYGRKDCF